MAVGVILSLLTMGTVRWTLDTGAGWGKNVKVWVTNTPKSPCAEGMLPSAAVLRVGPWAGDWIIRPVTSSVHHEDHKGLITCWTLRKSQKLREKGPR